MGSVSTNSPSNGSPTGTNSADSNVQASYAQAPSPGVQAAYSVQAASAGGLIPEPKEKLNANPDAVYELLGIKWNDRKKMQIFTRQVYQRHQLDSYETSFTRLPEAARKAAADEICAEYPEVIAKCDGPWFATWILNRRHKTARNKKTQGGDGGGGGGGIAQAAGLGYSGEGGNPSGSVELGGPNELE